MAKVKCEHIFKFHVYIDEPLEVFVYTNNDHFKDVDNLYEGEDKIREKYFTQERIDELKRKMCERIMSQDNPFQISCADYDGDYYVDESELLENIN